jgi:hypothetical protein
MPILFSVTPNLINVSPFKNESFLNYFIFPVSSSHSHFPRSFHVRKSLLLPRRVLVFNCFQLLDGTLHLAVELEAQHRSLERPVALGAMNNGSGLQGEVLGEFLEGRI